MTRLATGAPDVVASGGRLGKRPTPTTHNSDANYASLAAALWRFWQYWGWLREGRGWLESALGLPAAGGASGASEQSLGRARALSALAGVLYWQGEGERSGVLYEEALAIYRRLGDDQLIGEGLLDSAWGALSRGELHLATERARTALEHFRAAGDHPRTTSVKAWLLVMPLFTGTGGDFEKALAAVHEAIKVNRAAGRIHEAADWSGAVAQAYHAAGQPAERRRPLGLRFAASTSWATWACTR